MKQSLSFLLVTFGFIFAALAQIPSQANRPISNQSICPTFNQIYSQIYLDSLKLDQKPFVGEDSLLKIQSYALSITPCLQGIKPQDTEEYIKLEDLWGALEEIINYKIPSLSLSWNNQGSTSSASYQTSSQPNKTVTNPTFDSSQISSYTPESASNPAQLTDEKGNTQDIDCSIPEMFEKYRSYCD